MIVRGRREDGGMERRGSQSMLKKVSLPYRDVCICVCAKHTPACLKMKTLSVSPTHSLSLMHADPSGLKVRCPDKKERKHSATGL